MKTPKKQTRQAPASTVELHNVRIAIYRRAEIKNGTTYTGFLFTCTKDGKRMQVRRSTLPEAETAARDVIRQMVAGRSTAYTVTPEEHAELAAARSILHKHPGATLTAAVNQWHEATSILPHGTSLTDAARFYAAHLAKDQLPTISVVDLVALWRSAKESEGLSNYYITDTHRRLTRFAAAFQCPVASVTPEAITAWMDKQRLRGRNRNNMRNSIVTLLSFARERGYLPREEKHAGELVGRVKERVSAVGIYTPEEIQRILAATPERMIPAVAIAAFAGLRSAEILRMDWAEVKLDRGHIIVSPEKAKTAQRRIVPILPNLAAWLAPHVKEEGRVAPNYMHLDNLTRHFATICKAAGVTPQRNGFRHSFASYRLALVQSADQVALEMGNSPRKLFTNYRELVTPEQTAAWFNILPTAPENLVTFSAACPPTRAREKCPLS